MTSRRNRFSALSCGSSSPTTTWTCSSSSSSSGGQRVSTWAATPAGVGAAGGGRHLPRRQPPPPIARPPPACCYIAPSRRLWRARRRPGRPPRPHSVPGSPTRLVGALAFAGQLGLRAVAAGTQLLRARQERLGCRQSHAHFAPPCCCTLQKRQWGSLAVAERASRGAASAPWPSPHHARLCWQRRSLLDACPLDRRAPSIGGAHGVLVAPGEAQLRWAFE